VLLVSCFIFKQIKKSRETCNKYYNIYKEGNYNRFVYKSNYRLDRDKLLEYNRVLVEVLDYILLPRWVHFSLVHSS
jgi:hypothetical protein